MPNEKPKDGEETELSLEEKIQAATEAARKEAKAEADATVGALVDKFTSAVDKLAKPATPAGPSADEVKAQAAARWKAAKERANEKAAQGEFSDAVEEMYAAMLEINKQTSTPIDYANDPDVKARISLAKRTATADHKVMFNDYGAEIQAEIDKLDPIERTNPDNWDAAVTAVKAKHLDDIINKQLEERSKSREEDDPKSSIPAGVASASRRSRSASAGASSLDEDQLEFARMLGKTPEEYAESVTRYKEALRGAGSVSLVDDTLGPIKPGSF